MNLQRKSNLTSLVPILTGSLILALLALAFIRPMKVSGTSAIEENVFETKYAISESSRLDSCTVCHTSTSQPVTFNSYGAALDAVAGLTDIATLTAVENLDSDGDGWTNLQEIQFHTFPGNADDHPLRIFVPQSYVVVCGYC